MIFGLLGGADLARAYAVQVAVQNGARAGAEAYAIQEDPQPIDATNAAVLEMNRTPTINAGPSNVAVTEAQTDGVTTCVHPTTNATPCFVTVRVTYTWHAITSWPFLPNVANFDRSTIFQVFY